MDKEKLDLGISLEELQAMLNYVAGKADKPEFVNRFMTDINGRLKELLIVINELQLAEIPQLIEYSDRIKKELLSEKKLDSMDAKELSAIMINLNRNILSTIEIANRTIDNINKNEALNSDYRNLLNQLLLLPKDKLDKIQGIIDKNN